MSKLPNAPLIEVIFEIRWESRDKESLDKFQILIGSMYSELKKDFPTVLNLRPDSSIPFEAFVGSPTHRFSDKEAYPKYQLGPGVLSVNMTNDDYVWESFIKTIKKVVAVFENLSELQGKQISIALKYLDFFKCEFSEIDLKEYIKKNFHLSFEAPYLNDVNAKTFGFATSHNIENGVFTFTMNTGYNNVSNNQIEGIITESKVSNSIPFDDLHSFLVETLPTFHGFLGKFFKDFTEGACYDSFK